MKKEEKKRKTIKKRTIRTVSLFDFCFVFNLFWKIQMISCVFLMFFGIVFIEYFRVIKKQRREIRGL